MTNSKIADREARKELLPALDNLSLFLEVLVENPALFEETLDWEKIKIFELKTLDSLNKILHELLKEKKEILKNHSMSLEIENRLLGIEITVEEIAAHKYALMYRICDDSAFYFTLVLGDLKKMLGSKTLFII